jgi:hypothetical protein
MLWIYQNQNDCESHRQPIKRSTQRNHRIREQWPIQKRCAATQDLVDSREERVRGMEGEGRGLRMKGMEDFRTLESIE